MAPLDLTMRSRCQPRGSMLMRPGIRSLQARHAHEHNAQKSPLLRLPLELRKQIYEYTLGSNNLHMFQHPKQPSMHQTRLSCKVCITPCPCHVHLTAHLASINLTDTHRRHHHTCYTNVFGCRLDLSLLLACSQIYMEALLLPFSHNNFMFAETELLPLFTNKLAPMQAAAITSLTLDNITAFDLFDGSHWKPFPSLRNLAATVRGHEGCVDDNHFSLLGCRKLNRFLLLNARRWWCEEPAHAPLEKLNLEMFRFRVMCASGHRQTRCRTLGEWRQWAKMIEREVSERWTKQEARRRQEQTRLLQATKWPTLPLWCTRSLRETTWEVVRWIVLRLPIPICKEGLLRKLQSWMRVEA